MAKNGGSGCTEIDAKIDVFAITFSSTLNWGEVGLLIFVRRKSMSNIVRGAYRSGGSFAITLNIHYISLKDLTLPYSVTESLPRRTKGYTPNIYSPI